jgi:kojibiose phosphorylase
MSDGWSIIEPVFRRETAKAYEGLFTLGSGYLHVRGSLEEPLDDAPQNETYWRLPANVTAEPMRHPLSKVGTYVPGIYGRHPLLNNELINLPSFIGFVPSFDGERFSLDACDVRDHGRTLRLDDAVLERMFTWHTRAGAAVRVRFERFVSAARPHLCVQRLSLTPDRHARFDVEAGVDANVTTNGFDHLSSSECEPVGGDRIRCDVGTDSGDAVCIVSELRSTTDTLSISGCAVDTAGRRISLLGGIARCAGGRECVIEKRTAVTTSRDRRPASPEELLADARELTCEQLHAEHAALWKRRWDGCDVVIEGDPESQLAMRAALFHLLRAHPGGEDGSPLVDKPLAVDAKGYAGEAYWGRFFWDTEMYLLPFYLYTDPARARTLVDFRVRTLEGARANARRYGYPGARYAWESDADGIECCPNWQYADHEVHVTADVAFALVHYARVTGDESYLHGPAAEVLVETARYWMNRIDWRDDAPGRAATVRERAPAPNDPRTADSPSPTPVLLGVMGPDEYTPISDNNAYTNRLVAFALHAAAEFGGAGGATPEECRAFADVADRLPIPRSMDGSLVLQCENFQDLAEPHFDIRWRDRDMSFASQVSQERLYRCKALKQADVLMLMMLFPHEFSDEEVRTAWDYYLPYTTHDSSLSAGVHCIVACRLGLAEQAWRFWRRGSRIDLDVEQGGAAEGIHIANCGAMWQMAVLGFAGMKPATQAGGSAGTTSTGHDGGAALEFNPALPAAWRRLAFPMRWKGVPVYVELDRDGLTLHNRGARSLEVAVRNDRRGVEPGASRFWPTPPIGDS